MPRKKRPRRTDADDDGDVVHSKRRYAEKNETLVISDSENEEENFRTSEREDRLRERESRTRTRELTEEEMMELAVRLSEKEAGSAALRQRQEEEDIRLAIAQSLHANGMHTNSEDCESLPLVMTPVGGSQPPAGHSPTPAAESPSPPPRQKPLSRSARNRDVSTEDQFTTATAVGVAQSRKLHDPPSQPAGTTESPPIGTDTPVLAPPTIEEASPSQGVALGSGSDGESESSSAVFPSLAGGSPVFPGSSSQQPVLCIEKLSPALEQDCRSAGFVLCSQSGPASLTASSPPVSPEPPPSPTFSRSDRRERGQQPTGARDAPERAGGGVCAPSDDEETCDLLAPCKDPSLSRPQSSEQTQRPRLGPSSRSGASLEDHHKERSRDHSDSAQEQRPGGTSGRPAVGMSECSVAGAHQGVLQPEQDFPTQMTLQWASDNEDEAAEEGPVQKEESPIRAQSSRPPRSQNAVCEQSSCSESESLLRGVPAPVASPVFPREALPIGASRNPAPPQASLSPPSTLRAGVGGAKSVRRKFTFRDMYTAAPAVPSEKGEPSCSGGRGSQASPSLRSEATPTEEERGAGTVLYYWGVPFCPRGQNPDQYTQVIVTQLEVYEKSLKSAQRGLLHKAPWGEPVLPGPLKRPLCRRPCLKRPRPARPLRKEDEEEDEGEGPREAAEEEEEEETGGAQKDLEGGGGEGGGGAPDSDALEVPSQTLLEEQKSPLEPKTEPEEPTEKFSVLRRRALRDVSPVESETQILVDQEEEEEDEEEGMCPETQMSEENTLDVNMESPAGSQPRPESEGMEVEEAHSQPPAAAAEEASMEVEEEAQVRSEGVECPICMRGFPLSQIELHAAYCDGTAQSSAPDESSSQAMVLRKSTRTADLTVEDQLSSTSAKGPPPEKCFLCHGLFPVKEYESHVEACIRRKSSNQGARRLLSALERSEQNDSEAGPSHSSFRKKDNSRCDAPSDTHESGDSGGVAFPVSDSPIKSFTPISEATDCLVDFRRQYSGRPRPRASRKRKLQR